MPAKDIAFQDLRNIYIEEAAASDIDGSVTFMPADGHGHNRIEREGKVSCAVRSITLDTWANSIGLERLDAIKIDVEGAENVYLRVPGILLASFKPPIICEASIHTGSFGYQPDQSVTVFQGMEYQARWLEGVWTRTLIVKLWGDFGSALLGSRTTFVILL